MLQVARLSAGALESSADLVRDFLQRRFLPEGGAADRAGRADLYYTIFALAGMAALEAAPPAAAVRGFLDGFGDGAGLDFIHLGALARCHAALGAGGCPVDRRAAILRRIEAHRCADGGYDSEPGAARGTAYGCFVALGAYQDLGRELPEPMRMVQCLKRLETPDGAWGNLPGMRTGTVPATAAAVTLLHQLGLPIHADVAAWLLEQAHLEGGWLAVPGAPLPDLLSTATALHALACLECRLPAALREKCLDFIDTLWSAEGGFHGHWADDHLDAEYTFYGLLALGHLAVQSRVGGGAIRA